MAIEVNVFQSYVGNYKLKILAYFKYLLLLSGRNEIIYSKFII